MAGWLVLAIGLLIGAGQAWAAPEPDFEATPVQSNTCLAPCAYHFDAIGNGSDLTRDPAVARPFHALVFEWDFGDPDSGAWPLSGLPRNRAYGAIAGHLYERPGSYVVTLSVTNADGETSAVQQVVTVADPDAVFGASQTYCIANSGVPGGAGFEACPVASASSHVVIGAGVTNGFVTAVGSHCDARDRKTRCLFRRGDRFRSEAETGITGPPGPPGLIGAFGSGPPPLVEARGGRFLGINGDGWTVQDIDVVAMTADTGLFKLYNEKSRFTALRVRGWELTGGCLVSSASDAPTHSDLVAMVDVECRGSATIASAGGGRLFLRTERTLILGGVFDNAYKSSFVLRTVHFPRSVMQHARIERPDAGHNAITLRAWAGTAQGVCTTNPPPSSTRFVIFSDNLIEQQTDNTIVRSCQANECLDAPCSTGVEDVIFERNFLRLSSGSPSPNEGISRVFWLQGGDITVRNNVVDLQGVRDGLDQRLVQHGPNMTGSGSSNGRNVHVLNNTVYYDDVLSQSSFAFCQTSTPSGGHRCENNLAWLPGNRSGSSATSGGGWSSAANVFATSNPFAGMPPAQGATEPEDFQLGALAVIDSGVVAAAAAPTDFGLGCRPADGDDDGSALFDVGAWEAGADTACLTLPEPATGATALAAVLGLALLRGTLRSRPR